MRIHCKQLVLAIACASALLPAVAQTAGPQNSGPQNLGIDAALLAKANAGDPAAQVLLGESYAAGKGVARDLNQAAEWYRRASGKGDIAGELHLAALYRDGGKGLPRDMEQAAAWYRKAADQGDVGAQATLGLLYSIGQGVLKSDVEAYFWLDLAASVKGPKQEQYAANRQLIGTHITTSELEEVEERVAKWRAVHPRTADPR
jgi:TPR repeat protein